MENIPLMMQPMMESGLRVKNKGREKSYSRAVAYFRVILKMT